MIGKSQQILGHLAYPLTLIYSLGVLQAIQDFIELGYIMKFYPFWILNLPHQAQRLSHCVSVPHVSSAPTAFVSECQKKHWV